nr:hypothetical protein [Photorhabdus sp. CRCIA-P01]
MPLKLLEHVARQIPLLRALQASHPLREARGIIEDIDDNPGFFRIRLYAVPHFQEAKG